MEIFRWIFFHWQNTLIKEKYQFPERTISSWPLTDNIPPPSFKRNVLLTLYCSHPLTLQSPCCIAWFYILLVCLVNITSFPTPEFDITDKPGKMTEWFWKLSLWLSKSLFLWYDRMAGISVSRSYTSLILQLSDFIWILLRTSFIGCDSVIFTYYLTILLI